MKLLVHIELMHIELSEQQLPNAIRMHLAIAVLASLATITRNSYRERSIANEVNKR